MKLTDLIFWLALLAITTDGASFVIKLVHGPQAGIEKSVKPQEKSDGPSSDW